MKPKKTKVDNASLFVAGLITCLTAAVLDEKTSRTSYRSHKKTNVDNTSLFVAGFITCLAAAVLDGKTTLDERTRKTDHSRWEYTGTIELKESATSLRALKQDQDDYMRKFSYLFSDSIRLPEEFATGDDSTPALKR